MAVRDSRRDVVVGRDAELARARAVVRARREESQTLLITGPAGIGKTALAEAALIGLDADPLSAGDAAGWAWPLRDRHQQHRDLRAVGPVRADPRADRRDRGHGI